MKPALHIEIELALQTAVMYFGLHKTYMYNEIPCKLCPTYACHLSYTFRHIIAITQADK